jgi:hypothetical protein
MTAGQYSKEMVFILFLFNWRLLPAGCLPDIKGSNLALIVAEAGVDWRSVCFMGFNDGRDSGRPLSPANTSLASAE